MMLAAANVACCMDEEHLQRSGLVHFILTQFPLEVFLPNYADDALMYLPVFPFDLCMKPLKALIKWSNEDNHDWTNCRESKADDDGHFKHSRVTRDKMGFLFTVKCSSILFYFFYIFFFFGG